MPQVQPVSTGAMTPLEALRRIVETRPDAIGDPDILRSLLLDRCPEQASEVNRLVSAAREGVPEELKRADENASRTVVVSALAPRLAHQLGMSTESATWAVDAWYQVLVGAADSAGDAASSGPRSASWDFYSRAGNDLWRHRPTEAADRLKAEILAEMRGGRSAGDVQTALSEKGAPRIWTAEAVGAVDRELLRETLVAAAADVSAGRTASPNVAAALRFAAATLHDDPRVTPLTERLKRAGCSDELVAFLVSHDATIATQRSESNTFLAGGLGVTALGLGLLWVVGLDDPQNSAMKGVGLLVILGLAMAGKGMMGILRR